MLHRIGGPCFKNGMFLPQTPQETCNEILSIQRSLLDYDESLLAPGRVGRGRSGRVGGGGGGGEGV